MIITIQTCSECERVWTLNLISFEEPMCVLGGCSDECGVGCGVGMCMPEEPGCCLEEGVCCEDNSCNYVPNCELPNCEQLKVCNRY